MTGNSKKDLIQSTNNNNTTTNAVSLFNASNPPLYSSSDLAEFFPVVSTQSSNLNDNFKKENNTNSNNNNNSSNSIITDFADHHLTNTINNHSMPLNLSQSSSSSIQPLPSMSIASNHSTILDNNNINKKDGKDKCFSLMCSIHGLSLKFVFRSSFFNLFVYCDGFFYRFVGLSLCSIYFFLFHFN